MQGEFANFIDKQGSPICHLKTARFVFVSPGESSGLEAENFTFQQFIGQCPTIDFDCVWQYNTLEYLYRIAFPEAKVSQQLVQTQDLVDARLYENEEQVIRDALRHLLSDRPDLRVSVAVHRYRTDEELSLNQAAAIAGVSLERMKEILERYDVPLRLGPASIEEAKAEIAALEEWLGAHPD